MNVYNVARHAVDQRVHIRVVSGDGTAERELTAAEMRAVVGILADYAPEQDVIRPPAEVYKVGEDGSMRVECPKCP